MLRIHWLFFCGWIGSVVPTLQHQCTFKRIHPTLVLILLCVQPACIQSGALTAVNTFNKIFFLPRFIKYLGWLRHLGTLFNNNKARGCFSWLSVFPYHLFCLFSPSLAFPPPAHSHPWAAALGTYGLHFRPTGLGTKQSEPGLALPLGPPGAGGGWMEPNVQARPPVTRHACC